VDPDRLRFDFDHHQPVSREEIERIEAVVNEKIYSDLPVETVEMATEEAQELPGVRAFFGDKYGDRVRVVTIGDGFSREFCGGTHLNRTGETGLFKIVGEEGVAKGVRRITAVTGRVAIRAIQEADRTLRELAVALKTAPDQLANRVASMQEDIKELKKQRDKGSAADLKGVRKALLEGAERIDGSVLIVGEVPGAPAEQLRESMDWFRKEAESVAAFLASADDGKVMLMASVSDDLIQKGVKAGDWIKAVAPAVDGRGGGKPALAQAGGKNPAGIPQAIEKANAWVRERMSQ
jgi:alanyl-tRNA synthetase